MINLALAALITAADPPRAALPPQPDGRVDAPVADLSDGELREQVNAYLGSIDTPILPAQWRALGPRANALLEEVVKNANELPTRRAKAIGGLAALNGPNAPALFAQVAAREKEPVVMRFAAIRGLAQITPGRRVATALRPLLEGAKDSRVRALAGEQLVIRTSGKSCDLVRAQAARESGDARAHFDRALAHCEDGK